MIKLVKVLEQDELKCCKEKIFSLEKFLTKREGFEEFDTLGAATYLDYGNEHYGVYNSDVDYDNTKYEEIKNILNPILLENFSWLYKKLLPILTHELKTECIIEEKSKLAYPGFHLFYPFEYCDEPYCPVHLDSQFNYHLESLDKIYNKVEEDVITFTLSILLPKSGAGLYYWPLEKINSTVEEASNFYIDIIDEGEKLLKEGISRKEYEEKIKPNYLEYKEGYMSLFKGHLLHQIAPWKQPIYPDEERITLQGHGIKCDGKYIIYW